MGLLSFLQNVEISSVVIAIMTAVISISGALILTNRKINADLRMRRIELTRAYSEEILKRRLDAYRDLWYLLSHNLKIIHETSLDDRFDGLNDASKLKSLFGSLSDWDSKNALLLSRRSGFIMYKSRMQLFRMIKGDAANSSTIENSEWKKLMSVLANLEISIKTDIGIFEVDEFEARKAIDSYRELEHQFTTRS